MSDNNNNVCDTCVWKLIVLYGIYCTNLMQIVSDPTCPCARHKSK